MSKFVLHFPSSSEISVIDALQKLGAGLHWKPTDPHVYILQGEHTDAFLSAMDGKLIRHQGIRIFRSAQAAKSWRDTFPAGESVSSLSAWVESMDDPDELAPVDLVARPLRLVSFGVKRRGPGDWEAIFEEADFEALGVRAVVDKLSSHIRTFPASFTPWPMLLMPETLARFAKTFPASHAPAVVLVPEPQVDTVDPSHGITWAKYWVYGVHTLDPLGVIIGVRSREFVKRITAKK